jgi:hypothetical protein
MAWRVRRGGVISDQAYDLEGHINFLRFVTGKWQPWRVPRGSWRFFIKDRFAELFAGDVRVGGEEKKKRRGRDDGAREMKIQCDLSTGNA